MKTVYLEEENLDLITAIDLARREPLLLVTSQGREFLLTEADDFEKEAEALRNSASFQRFLEERSLSPRQFSLEQIEAEVERKWRK